MSLAGLRNQTITITKTGPAVDVHGIKAKGATVTEKVRIEPMDETFVDLTGREAFVKARIFFRSGADVQTEDIVTVLGTDMEILILEQMVSGQGKVHHLEGKVGRRSRPA